jgi:quercetin dioxygenase-like cupin family protein
MIVKQKDKPVKSAYGVEFKALATGDRIMCTIMRFKKGGKVPKHKHPAEQVGYLIKGKFKLWINDEMIGILEPGDSYAIKSGEIHSMEMLENSEWVDMFSPPREEYMDK